MNLSMKQKENHRGHWWLPRGRGWGGMEWEVGLADVSFYI